MIEKTVTTDATLGIKKAPVKVTLPVINLDCYRADDSNLKSEIRSRVLDLVGELLDKNLT